jgi:hypothetical protein
MGRNGRRRNVLAGLPIVLALIVLLGGCGSSSSSSTSAQLTPAEYSTAQRVETYRLALGKILAPFTHPQVHPEDLAHADALLRTSVGELRRLVPPPAFAGVHATLTHDTEAERSALVQFSKARRSKDAVALSNAQATAAQATAKTRADIVRLNAVIKRCRAEHFAC